MGIDWRVAVDCTAPALALAQAIGRWGNYFNQELYGSPSRLPWAVKIDHPAQCTSVTHCVAFPPRITTFQPTFLYESIWDLACVGLILLAERRLRIRKGYLFFVYAALYTIGRFVTERLRIDEAHRYLGLRLNDWVSIAVFVLSVAILITRGRAQPGEPSGPSVRISPASNQNADDHSDADHQTTSTATEPEAHGQPPPRHENLNHDSGFINLSAKKRATGGCHRQWQSLWILSRGSRTGNNRMGRRKRRGCSLSPMLLNFLGDLASTSFFNTCYHSDEGAWSESGAAPSSKADVFFLLRIRNRLFGWMTIMQPVLLSGPHLYSDHAAYWFLMQVGSLETFGLDERGMG